MAGHKVVSAAIENNNGDLVTVADTKTNKVMADVPNNSTTIMVMTRKVEAAWA